MTDPMTETVSQLLSLEADNQNQFFAGVKTILGHDAYLEFKEIATTYPNGRVIARGLAMLPAVSHQLIEHGLLVVRQPHHLKHELLCLHSACTERMSVFHSRLGKLLTLANKRK